MKKQNIFIIVILFIIVGITLVQCVSTYNDILKEKPDAVSTGKISVKVESQSIKGANLDIKGTCDEDELELERKDFADAITFKTVTNKKAAYIFSVSLSEKALNAHEYGIIKEKQVVHEFGFVLARVNTEAQFNIKIDYFIKNGKWYADLRATIEAYGKAQVQNKEVLLEATNKTEIWIGP